MNKKIGIYKITNLVNNKIYIGSSISLGERWTNHKISLRNNKHDNIHLQRAYNKYGKDNFKFDIIEYVDNVDILIDREQHWIDKLDICNDKIGYNICPTAGNCLGRELSEKTKNKLRVAFLGRKHTDESKQKMREAQIKNGTKPSFKGFKWSKDAILKVSKQVINLDTGETFISISEASRFYNPSISSIVKVCKGQRRTCGRFRWKYLEDYNIGD